MDAGKRLSIFISHPSEFLTDCRLHGDGLIAFEYIQRLAQRGHQLHVAVQAATIQRELPDNITLYPIPTRVPSSAFKPLEYMVRVRQLFQQIQRDRGVDIIHQLNPVNPGLSSGLVGTPLPVVLGIFFPYWPSDSDPPRFKSSIPGAIAKHLAHPIVQWCDRTQQRQASALLLSTPAARSRLYDSNACQDRTYLLPCGIDIHQFTPADPAPTSASLSILYLARLAQQKGIFTLLEAFANVVQAFPTCQLTIAGSGPDEAQVKQQVDRLDCRAQISLLGEVAREQVPATVQQCSLCCMPSYGEPFGLSALEAMACGKPLVVTDAGGLAHLVSEQGGYKVAPRDSVGLATALSKLLASANDRQRMGDFNRRWVEEHYSWERIIDRLETIYWQLLD